MAFMDKKRGQIFIITGPSGAGKTEISKKVLENKLLNAQKVITCTTRPRREGEVDGKDYFFISKEEFLENIKNNKLFEFAEVYGNFYGSRKQDVEFLLNEGVNVIFVIDVQGAYNMKKIDFSCKVIFVKAESIEELKGRLIGRNTDSEDVIQKRINAAMKEMELENKFDYSVLNPNGKIVQAIQEIERIIKV